MTVQKASDKLQGYAHRGFAQSSIKLIQKDGIELKVSEIKYTKDILEIVLETKEVKHER